MSINPVADAASAALQPAQVRCWTSEDQAGGQPDREFRSDMRYADTNDLINSMQGLAVDGRPLTEVLRLDGASMWQFLPSYLWPDAFRAVEITKAVTDAVRSLAPDALVTLPSGDRYDAMWQQIGSAVAASEDLEHHPRAGKAGLAQNRPLALRPRGLAHVARDRWAQRRAATSSRWTPPTADRKLLFATLLRHWVEDPNRPGHRYDEQLSPLLDSLRAADWQSVVAVDCPYNAAPDLASITARQQETPDWVTWRSFNAHGGPSLAQRRALAQTSNRWGNTVAAAATIAGESLGFRGVELGPALAPTLGERVGAAVAECAEMRAQARRMLEVERPDAVMASYETGPYARALLIEAARVDIPTVGLQHGMILDNHYDYMHAGVGPDPGRHAFTIPDRTCVWGPFWQRVLTQAGHYPDSAVSITGNWRHMRPADERNSAEAGRRALAVPSDQDLVLVCTAAQGTEELVRALGKLPAVLGPSALRIRPHPSEDLDAIAAVYAEEGGDPGHVSRDGELTEVLAASSLVISQLSTVISEAVLADRPVVVADFDRQEGWDAYKRSEATLVAADPDELAAAVATVLSETTVAERLRQGRAKLVDDFFNGRDGRAAERVVAALEG
jgi:hypothetical protein